MRWVLVVVVACGCTPPPEDPNAAEVAAYFGMADGALHTFTQESGLEETHEYTRQGGVGEREVFDRVVRRGGFVEDELTMRVEASVERGLEILRYYDCLNRCAVPADAIGFLPWPLEEGASLESEVEVEVSNNGTVEETHSERHRFQLGGEEQIEVPAGTFAAYRVIWSRTVGEESESVELAVAPDEGIIISEGFDGARFERAE